MSEAEKAVLVHANWRAALDGEETRGAYEVPLFTDAQIENMGPIKHGPYQFFYLDFVPVQDRTCGPRIMIRIEDYISSGLPGQQYEEHLIIEEGWEPVPQKKKRRIQKDDERYHGGGLDDEIAALLSLSLGIRLKPGGISRLFINPQRIPLPDHMRDERGRPTSRSSHKNPVFLQNFHTPVIPHAVEPIPFNTQLFATLDTLETADVTALVRTARLYQDGLWMAEAMPEWTWLKFVSAVETAAVHWRTAIEPAEARLRADPGFKRLVEILEAYGGKKLVAEAAHELMNYAKLTKKFLDFIRTFRPEAPPIRPEKNGQFAWKPQNLKEAMYTIYDYRSQILHAGRAFPSPMMRPPEKPTGWTVLPEKPLSLSVQRFEAAWDNEDLPIFLHTFEYIVRNALCKWWVSMVEKAQNKATNTNSKTEPLSAK